MATNNAMTDYLETAIMQHIFTATSMTSPTTVYLALFTTLPTDASGGTEITTGEYENYVRQAITFGAPASRAITQSGDVTFPQAGGGSTGATASYYAVYDSATVGNMLSYGALSAGKAIAAGNTPSVASGEVVLTMAANEVSDYLAEAILNHVFRNTAYTRPNPIYAFLTTVALTDTSTGSSITEPANNYARPSSGAWTVTGNSADNDADITFATPTGTWGSITAGGLADATTAGNVLFYDNSPTGDGQTPTTDDVVKISAGGYTATLD